MTASKSQFSIPRLPQALAAAGLAVALAACGGGGSETAPTSMEPDGPTPEEMAAERAAMQRAKINEAIAAARPMVSGINDESTASQVTDAESSVEAIAAAIAAAADVPQTEKDQATTAHDVLLADLNRALARRTAYLDNKEKERMAMERKMRNDAVMPYATAISDWKVSPTLETYPTGIRGLTIDNKDGATMIKLLRTDNTEIPKDKVTAPSGLTAYKFMIEDKKNYGTVFTTHGDSTTVVKNYAWDNLFGITERTDTNRDGTTTNTDAKFKIATSANDSDVITFSTSSTAARPYNLMSGDFDTPGLLSTTAKSATYSQPGNFLGVSGTFACNGCTISANDDGIVTVSGAAMTFTPSASINLGNQSVALSRTIIDTDYMHFGYWVTTGGTAAKPTKMIDTFALAEGYAGISNDNADGLVATTDADTQLRGKATYSGAAAGIYVLKTGTVGDEDLYNGEFTATANLTAQFGELKTGTVAETNQYRIDGTISGFKPTEGSHDLSGWSLSLNKADLGNPTGSPVSRRAAATLLPNYDGIGGLQSFTGTTSGGGANGQWHGKFYGGDGEGFDMGADADDIPAEYTALGNIAADGLGEDQARFDDHPLAVVGEFNGHFSNGHVVGAFGAEKD